MDEKEILNNWEYFKTLLRKTNRDGVEDFITWLDSTDFKYAPSSMKDHCCYQGGLLEHSINVYYHMYDFKNFLDFFEIPEDSIILTSLLHDICKIYTYKVSMRNTKDESGKWIQVPYYEWDDIEPLGHGEKSVMYMYEHGLIPTPIERAMIRNHMGFSMGSDSKREVSCLFSRCPQSLVLHWADELATYVPESKYLSPKFKSKLFGRNLNECNSIKKQIDDTQSITVNDKTYRIAPSDSVVDNNTIIGIKLKNGETLKVYNDLK